MSTVFAFNVAEPASSEGIAPQPEVEGYDAGKQRLVWRGDQEATLGAAVCTNVHLGGWDYCQAHPSWCEVRQKSCCGCWPSGAVCGFKCDYG
jgi:hypothetical protein